MKDLSFYIFLFLLGATHLNLAIAIAARIKTLNREYNKLILYWVFLLIAYFSAALLSKSETAIAFSFFFQLPAILTMARFLHDSRKMSFNLKFYLSLFLLGAGMSAGLLTLTETSFTLALIPLSIVLSVPLLLPAWDTLVTNWKRSSWIEKGMAWIFLTGIVNIFNFAFFRLEPNAAWWGWGISIAQYQCLSIFVPLLIHHQSGRVEKVRLEQALKSISGLETIHNQKVEELYKLLETEIHTKKMLTDRLTLINNLLIEEKAVSDKLYKTVTHDLASPMMVISSYLNMIKSGRIPQEDFSLTVEKIKNNTESALILIEKIRENLMVRKNQVK